MNETVKFSESYVHMDTFVNDTYNTELYGRPAVETSATHAWSGLRVERYQLDAMALPAHFHQHHLLILHQGNNPVHSQRQNGIQTEEALFSFGDAGLYPAGEYGRSGWDGPTDTIHLYLDAQWLETRIRESVELTHFALRDRFQFKDELLTQLGQQLLLAVGSQHALGHLYAESLINTLSYHLIEHHATFERRITGTSTRLPGPVLDRIDAYLEAFVQESITLEALAGLANLSVFHFARRFKRTTGLSPYQYVMSWKIRRARQLLRTGDMPIAVISDLLGFASPAHFSAAFKRAVGQSPRDFQRG